MSAHRNSSVVPQEDWSWIPKDPDPDFSEEHNNEVIEGTIRKYEAELKRRDRATALGNQERIEAMAKYINHLKEGGKAGVEEYFGKRVLLHLKGQNILDRLQGKL